jgi:hypothetical protein
MKTDTTAKLRLVPETSFAGMRVLAWHGDCLYASKGYELFRAQITGSDVRWESVARWQPEWWRQITSRTRLGSRLVRDGFHALAVLDSGTLVGAVPGAIVTLASGEREFRLTHRVLRGTRPLHIASTPDGRLYWGEYFDNAARDEVHIYGSADSGSSWQVVHTFPKGQIRHVHNLVYDRWLNCIWAFTGDYGEECRILRASTDFTKVEVVLSGNQQARAVAALPAQDGLYFSTDTPLEQNFVYRLDRSGALAKIAPLSGSSIYGCSVGESLFFSTMVEPSEANPDQDVRVYGASRGVEWASLLEWRKDFWPMRFFQYGNAFLPDGVNKSNYLAITTIAVAGADQTLHLFRVE